MTRPVIHGSEGWWHQRSLCGRPVTRCASVNFNTKRGVTCKRCRATWRKKRKVSA